MPSVKQEKFGVRPQIVLEYFSQLWEVLFTSPMHLDSALSKLPKHVKPILAQIVPVLLQRPASIAHFLRLDIHPGEPWSLSPQEKAQWRTAFWMCERLYKAMRRTDFRLEAHAFVEDFPHEMNRVWREQLGPAGAKHMAGLLTKEAPMSLRVSRRADPKEILSTFNDSKELPRATLSRLSPLGIVFSKYGAVMKTEAYQKGLVEIQDEGSQLMAIFALWPDLVAPLLTKIPGKFAKESITKITLPKETPAWTVIDACAGAGGKTLALADALLGRGQVFAYDIYEKKLAALKQRAKRAGWNNIKTVLVKEGEEAKTVSKFRKRANVVLVDAPCSGWGVLRRNPDIKWRQTPAVLKRMPEIQLHLLDAYSELVAPGGRLVYGLCTFRPEETTEVVNKFLETHKDFEFQHGGYLGPGSCDGFFMASFTRKAK